MSEKERTALYLAFMLDVVEELQFDFPDELHNPFQLAKNYLNQQASELEYIEGAKLCWRFIEKREAMRNFSDKEILLARLCLSLLCANKNLGEVGEKLAWFFEVLDYLKVDLERPLKLMAQGSSLREINKTNINTWDAKVELALRVTPILESYKELIQSDNSYALPTWVCDECAQFSALELKLFAGHTQC